VKCDAPEGMKARPTCRANSPASRTFAGRSVQKRDHASERRGSGRVVGKLLARDSGTIARVSGMVTFSYWLTLRPRDVGAGIFR